MTDEVSFRQQYLGGQGLCFCSVYAIHTTVGALGLLGLTAVETINTNNTIRSKVFQGWLSGGNYHAFIMWQCEHMLCMPQIGRFFQ